MFSQEWPDDKAQVLPHGHQENIPRGSSADEQRRRTNKKIPPADAA